MSLLPMPNGKPQEKHIAVIESFDSLARWHLLSDSLSQLKKKLNVLYDTPIDIYCAWDESVSSMNHYISFCTRESLDYFEKRFDINTVNSELFEELKRRDKWSVIDDTVYQPSIIIWNKLSKEQQFKLLYQ